MMVGVNGTGKTTTIGKIAWHLSKEFGLSVVMGAGDTYRAAAAEQLAEWAERAGAELVRGRGRRRPRRRSPTTRSPPPSPAAPTWSSSTPPAASTPRTT